MVDKNGVEMVTGMVVKVSNAFFKNDNGLFFVDRSPGDPSWCGRDYSLHKISKSGKISTAKYRFAFWPLKAYVSDRAKSYEADRWNRENAEIEVVDIANTFELKTHFQTEANDLRAQYEHEVRYWGENECAKTLKRTYEHREQVASRL